MGQSCTNSKAKTVDGTERVGCQSNACPYIYYPRLSEDLKLSVKTKSENFASWTDIITSTPVLYGVCLEKCPNMGDIVCNYNYTEEKVSL